LNELDQALAAYYDAEAAAGARTEVSELRQRLRASFLAHLRDERVESLADVGGGPGVDAIAFIAAGFPTVALDLSYNNAMIADRLGCPAIVGSIAALPLVSKALDAAWTMSTVVHVPDSRIDDVLGEVARVVRPEGVIGIGTWGGRDWEGTSDFTRFDPPRFFSLRSHDRWRSIVERHGDVVSYDTFETAQPGWEYQFAILRTDGSAH
jgi:SAM-dependent methyltransferase